MKLIKINDGYINADKIIQIYERPINPNDSDRNLTVVGAVNEAPDGKIKDWLFAERVNTFAQSWVNGYEVKKEKRYAVRIRNLNVKNRFLVYDNFEGTWEFNPRYISNERYRVYHTRKELEADCFGWVFDCEGIVIEEVE